MGRKTPSVIPFITAWSGETVDQPAVVRSVRRIGIAFADEQPQDRDRDGVLWLRQRNLRGTGQPDLNRVHSARQRLVTQNLRCQVCTDDVVEQHPSAQLWMLRDIGPISEGERTTAGPVCVPCARITAEECPHLRRHVAAWVSSAPLWGVAGIVYDPLTLRPVPPEDREQGRTLVAYDDPRLPWTLAELQVLELNGCAPVSVADLAALQAT